MCQMSMKLSLPCLIKIPLILLINSKKKTDYNKTHSQNLTLRPNVKVIAEMERQSPGEQKTCHPKRCAGGSFGVTGTPTPTTAVKQVELPMRGMKRISAMQSFYNVNIIYNVRLG